MNKKLNELLNAANLHFSTTAIADGDPRGTARMVPYSKVEKLAELIVRECAIVASRAENNDRELRSMYDVIHEHFGVKQ